VHSTALHCSAADADADGDAADGMRTARHGTARRTARRDALKGKGKGNDTERGLSSAVRVL
jgi:hypothetical protein